MDSTASPEPRRLSALLILGILALPAVFAWFTLRRGYTRDVRIGAFAYLAVALVLGLVHSYTVGLQPG